MGGDTFSQAARALFNLVSGTYDFAQHEFVMVLPQEVSSHLDGETYIYAVSSDQAEIIAVDSEQLKHAQENGPGRFIPLSALSENGMAAYQMELREDMANVISKAMDFTNPDDTGVVGSHQWLDTGEIGPVPKDLATLSNLSAVLANHFEIADRPVTGGRFSDEGRQETFERALGVENALHRGIRDAEIAINLPNDREGFEAAASSYFGDDFEVISQIIDPEDAPMGDVNATANIGQQN